MVEISVHAKHRQYERKDNKSFNFNFKFSDDNLLKIVSYKPKILIGECRLSKEICLFGEFSQ
jgi:hypothetical protein